MNNHVIFFDGHCILCSRTVKILRKIDRRNKFCFSLIDSSAFKAHIDQNLMSTIPDSVVLLSENIIFVKSDSVIKIFEILGGFWKIFMILNIIPKKLRDFFYDFIASSRYNVFGKTDSCYIPSDDEKHLFLS